MAAARRRHPGGATTRPFFFLFPGGRARPRGGETSRRRSLSRSDGAAVATRWRRGTAARRALAEAPPTAVGDGRCLCEDREPAPPSPEAAPPCRDPGSLLSLDAKNASSKFCALWRKHRRGVCRPSSRVAPGGLASQDLGGAASAGGSGRPCSAATSPLVRGTGSLPHGGARPRRRETDVGLLLWASVGGWGWEGGAPCGGRRRARSTWRCHASSRRRACVVGRAVLGAWCLALGAWCLGWAEREAVARGGRGASDQRAGDFPRSIARGAGSPVPSARPSRRAARASRFCRR